METTYSAIHFATNIVEMYPKASFKQVLSNQRLQRLIFLYHLHYLKEYNKHFFNESFIAFKLGGVIKNVYSEYKVFGTFVNQPAKYLVRNETGFEYAPYEKMSLTDKQSIFLYEIIEMYDHLNEWELADICIDLMKSENIEERSTITKRQLVNMSSLIKKEK